MNISEKQYAVAVSIISSPGLNNIWGLIAGNSASETYDYISSSKKIETQEFIAKKYSIDNENWCNLPKGLGLVTGKIDKSSYALIMDSLEIVKPHKTIDLWNYLNYFKKDEPLKIVMGGSTLCCINEISPKNKNIKTHIRKIVAIGKLVEPYCVWLNDK